MRLAQLFHTLVIFLFLAPKLVVGDCSKVFAPPSDSSHLEDLLFTLQLSQLSSIRLPESISVSSNKAKNSELFESTSRVQMLTPDEYSRLKKTLKLISLQSLDLGDQETLDFLKEVRSKTASLRGAFYVLSDAHEAPKTFETFVVDLGHLNDFINSKAYLDKSSEEVASDLSNKLDSKIRDQAKVTLKSLKSSPDSKSLIKKFEPANASSFVEMMKDSLRIIEKDLARQKLDTTQFHEARKKFKNFMNYFEFSSALNPQDQSLKFLAGYCRQLVDDYGKLHDALIEAQQYGFIDEKDFYIQSNPKLNEALKIIRSRTLDFTQRVTIGD